MTDKVYLLMQAARLRRLAEQVMDDRAEQAMLELAAEYEQRAAAAQEQEAPPTPS